jgi:hypothetical protein
LRTRTGAMAEAARGKGQKLVIEFWTLSIGAVFSSPSNSSDHSDAVQYRPR